MKYRSLLLLLIFLIYPFTSFALDTSGRIDAIEQALPALETLLQQCEAQGMDMGYERADFAVLREFIGYGRQDMVWGDDVRAAYVADSMESLYASTQDTLNQYLAGTRQPLAVKRNYPENYGGAKDGNFVDQSGKAIIQNGYGVFSQLKTDLNKMQEFGADIAQIEIGPNAVLVEKGSINGWGVQLYNGGQATAEVADGGRNNTAKALKIVNTTPSGTSGYLSLNQNVDVRPNTAYQLTVNAKTVSAGTFFFSPQGWTAGKTYISKGTSDWTTYSASYVTGADEYNMEILFVSSSASSAVYLDDISLCQSGSSVNMIQNSGFEDSAGEQSEHFQANTAGIRNKITRALDDAYINHVMVNVLISPHYFPSWILNLYPETTAIDSGMGYDMNNSIIREALDLYIKVLMGEIGEHPALHSVCITNEPKCDTRKTSGLTTKYSAYLSAAYGDAISTLNAVYGKAYTSFSQVTMPATDSMDAPYYDWVRFNNAYTADWHLFLAQTVKKYQPDVAVHAKMMTIFGKSDSLDYGVDPEDFAIFTDYSGNDAWGFYGSTASGLLSKLMWYDLLRSIKKDAPIINSEDHIIEDGNTNYSPNQAVHAAADIWQGAVHGRDASIIWIWGRNQNPDSSTYGNILYRPDVLSAVSRKSFDLNRLSDAVADLQAAENKVTILYSPTARAYSSNAVSALKFAYESALYAGANPGFITERQLENGTTPQGVLIIPNVAQIGDAALSAVTAYRNGGGKILALGSSCLTKNQYNQQRATSPAFDQVVSLTMQGTTVTSPTVSAVQAQIAQMTGVSTLLDTSGQAVTNVEWVCASTNGATLWNVCNYDWSGQKQIVISKNATDLLTGTVYTDFVPLQPFVPVLLSFDEPMPPCMSVRADVTDLNLTRKIDIFIENTGGAADYLVLSIQVQNDETERCVDTAHVKKYVGAGESVRLTYCISAPAGENTLLIHGYYNDYNNQIDEIKIDL